MKVCLDAGHGYKKGFPTGARSREHGIVEDDLALTLVDRIGHYLRAAGHETVFSRPTKDFVPLKDRAKFAKQQKCDLFCSVHFNAVADPHGHGAEIVVRESDTRSVAVAQRVLSEIVAEGMEKRGILWDTHTPAGSICVLRNTYAAMPAILVEPGFVGNDHDAARLQDRYWRERVAKRIASALTQTNTKEN